MQNNNQRVGLQPKQALAILEIYNNGVDYRTQGQNTDKSYGYNGGIYPLEALTEALFSKKAILELSGEKITAYGYGIALTLPRKTAIDIGQTDTVFLKTNVRKLLILMKKMGLYEK